MAYLTKGIRDRVFAILTTGYGYGTSTHAIASAEFRTLDRHPGDRFKYIDDPGLGAGLVDRSIEWRWDSLEHLKTSGPVGDGRGQRRLEADLYVAYIFGEGSQAFVRVVSGESAADAGLYVTDRALSDAERHFLALSTRELWGGTTPAIVGIKRLGPSRLQHITPAYQKCARLLCVTRYEVSIDRDNTTVIS